MTSRPADRPVPGRRLGRMLAIMVLIFGAVAVRLTDVQIVSTQRYAQLGNAELVHRVELTGTRGAIYDRNGAVLAMSVPETTVIADPFQISDPLGESRRLAPVLGVPQATLARQLSEHAGFVYLARKIANTVGDRVKALNLPGITFESEPKRVLPDDTLALPVIGEVGTDGNGLGGLEHQYNRVLSGRPGRAVLQQDPEGRPIPGGLERLQPALPGKGLELTLDRAIQYEAEQALSQEIVASKAKGGMAIVMGSRTGDVLALADLVVPGTGGPPVAALSPLALVDVYEPGSVAKVATFAAALQEGIITPDQTVTIPSQLLIDGTVFHDSEPHGTEQLSATQVLAQSSNIGTIEIAEQLGKYAVDHELRAFGWGRPTGLHFPGESAGLLVPPAKWSGTAIGSVPIGQDSAVTAMQVLDTYNTLANGGVAVQPRLVQATVGPGGGHDPVPLPATHRVVSPRVASELTAMLEQVVSDGTAPMAAVPGYVVAGKTGTAQIPRTDAPGYQPGAYMASFAGYVPAQRPAISAIVVLDQPDTFFGGTAAAPVFSQIAQYALRRLDVPPVATSPPTDAGAGSANTTIGPPPANRPGP